VPGRTPFAFLETNGSSIPPNLKFVIDDAEDQWLYETGFDYIHLRLMAGCFSDWQNLFNQAFQ
jgi:hypothetical protein